MPRRGRNLLIIMSDEHDPRHMGVAGSKYVKTPNLDRFAARSARFTTAYTPSPICVPARAAMMTGRYVHDCGYWDNALAYDGRQEGWTHKLRQNGVRVESIGKLHFRNASIPAGFDRQHVPMHLAEGHGMIWGSVRDPLPNINYKDKPRMIGAVGKGESNYTRFDRTSTQLALDWLETASKNSSPDPWVLFVGLVAPHFPLVAPEEFAALYHPDDMPRAKLRPDDGFSRHPWLQDMDNFWPHDEGFADDAERRKATAMYFGLCSFLDSNVGRLLDAVDSSGLNENTNVLYLSDHGDNLGARGMWGKSTLYQESVAIPMMLAGPQIEPAIIETPVSLIDLYPTVLAATGVAHDPHDERPGRSLFDVIRDPAPRIAFSEYHAVAAPSGAFMIRKGKWKYHYYVGYPPELFDLEADPEEALNLASDPALADVVADLHAELLHICDPVAVDRAAKRAQSELIDSVGGRERALTLGNIGATPAPVAS